MAGLWSFAAALGGLRCCPVHDIPLPALTKADNVGLALVAAGLAVQSGSWPVAARLAVTWLLVNLASAAVAHLIARTALQRGHAPWQG